MTKIKRVTCSTKLYAYDEQWINKTIEDFCEECSSKLENFRIESHSIIRDKGETEHCEYEGTYTTPDTFDIHIIYSYDCQDLNSYLCIDKTSIHSDNPRMLNCKADSKKSALFKAVSYFSIRGNSIKESDIVCKELDEISKYE